MPRTPAPPPPPPSDQEPPHIDEDIEHGLRARGGRRPPACPAGRGRHRPSSGATAGGAVAAEACDAVTAHGIGEATVHVLDAVPVAFDRGRLTAIVPSESGTSRR